MKIFSEIVNAELISSSAITTEEPTVSQEAIELVNYLFKIFDVHISAFKYFAEDNDKLNFAKQEWVASFQQAKLELNEVVIGAQKVRESVYAFMIAPAEFIELCRPKIETRPQLDTREPWVKDWMENKQLTSDKHEAKRLAIGREALKKIKEFL